MPTNCRRILALGLMAVVLLCHEHGRAAATGRMDTPPSQIARPPFSIFVLTDMNNVDEAGAVDQLSVLVEHRAVLKCTALTPGKTYRGSWSLKDADGRELLADTQFQFVATEAQAWLSKRYVPPDRIPSAGIWNWRVTVEGQGPLAKQLSILPPTKDEAEKLASYQQVRENVLHAFALSWRYYKDAFFTVVGAGTAQEKLVQVMGLSPAFNYGRCSLADSLNGFTVRGSAKFGFLAWREYTSANGWSEWKDVSEAENAQRFNDLIVGFEFYLKDGHCKLVADDKTEFVDRRQLGGSKRRSECPTKEYVQKAVTEGDSLRKRERAGVEKLRAQPESVIDGVTETSDAIRASMGSSYLRLFMANVQSPTSDQ